ncbi:MAG: response regulator [Promethearchaeota archaeon]
MIGLLEKPNVIILDHQIPYKNGLETLEEILKIDKSSKVILTSAVSSIKKETMLKGAKIFLDKTFSLESYIKLFSNY